MLISMTTGAVKIIDFGFAASAAKPLKMYCGTRSYMPPEIINKKAYMGKECDI